MRAADFADAPGPKLPRGPAGKALHEMIVAERKAFNAKPNSHNLSPATRSPTRDALVALQYGKLSGAFPVVIRRIEKALHDENDPLHQMVMEKMIARVMPQAFWDRLGTQEFESTGGNKPVQVVVNVGPALPPERDVVSEQGE